MWNSYRWKILILSFISMFAYGVVFQSIPPVLNFIKDEMHLSHAALGGLMSFLAIPGIIVALPGGLLTDRFGPKKIGIISILLMLLGTLIVSIGKTYSLLLLGRLIAGTGGAVLTVVIPQLLSQWFHHRETGLAMGIYDTAFPLASVVVFNTLGVLAFKVGWRQTIFGGAALTIIALVVFLGFYKNNMAEKSSADINSENKVKLVRGGIWLLASAWMWYNAAVISFTTFAPDIFTSKGFSTGQAGFIASFIMMGSIVIGPISGLLVDKIGRKEIIILTGTFLMTVMLPFTPFVRQIIPFMIGLGVCVALLPAPLFALPIEIMKPEQLGLGFGIISAAGSLGVVFGPFLVGLARDMSGNYQMGFYLMAVFAFFTVLSIALLLKARGRGRSFFENLFS